MTDIDHFHVILLLLGIICFFVLISNIIGCLYNAIYKTNTNTIVVDIEDQLPEYKLNEVDIPPIYTIGSVGSVV